MAGLVLVSGGQSGVDRAVLAFAVEQGLPYQGWCPAGGWAEDLPEPPGVRRLYPLLQETETADPAERTRRNVEMADRVLTLWPRGGDRGRSPGTLLGENHARARGVPLFEMALDAGDAGTRLAELLAVGGRLLIGGPRESEAPGAEAMALAALRSAWETVSPGTR